MLKELFTKIITSNEIENVIIKIFNYILYK